VRLENGIEHENAIRGPPPLQNRDGQNIRRSHRTKVPSLQAVEAANFELDNSLSAIEELLMMGIEIPDTYTGSQQLKEAENWHEATILEFDQVADQGTYEIVDIPDGVSVIPSKIVYDVKLNNENEVKKYKARWVAGGHRQKQGVNYDQTFAAVARMKSFRLIVALSVLLGWKVTQLDVSNAFLHGTLKEEVYMSPPRDFFKLPPGKCLKLKKCLYGFKQASREWNLKLKQVLAVQNFFPLKSDPCVFKHSGGKGVISVHVDDLLFATSDELFREQVIKGISQELKITDDGLLNSYIGIQVHWDKLGNAFLYQHAYLKRVLARFGMENCLPANCPTTGKDNFIKNTHSDPDMNMPYLSAIGSLLYAASGTRPDIAFIVNKLSQFNQYPTTDHWKAIERIFRYVKTTLLRGIVYSKGQHDDSQPIKIQVFSDADWGADSNDRRSTSGYVIMVAGGPVIWSSRKQKTAAHSSCESEYMAIDEAAREIMWVRNFLSELDIDYCSPVELLVGNRGAKALSENPVHHSRVKHIDIRYHYIRDCVFEGLIKLTFVPSENNLADIFTKSLDRTKFVDLSDRFMSYF
jgi:hypothetical protein